MPSLSFYSTFIFQYPAYFSSLSDSFINCLYLSFTLSNALFLLNNTLLNYSFSFNNSFILLWMLSWVVCLLFSFSRMCTLVSRLSILLCCSANALFYYPFSFNSIYSLPLPPSTYSFNDLCLSINYSYFYLRLSYFYVTLYSLFIYAVSLDIDS